MPANHEIHGYMPMRREFEHETDNDAESIIKDIEFTEEDSEQDRGGSMTLLDFTTIFPEATFHLSHSHTLFCQH